MRAFNKQFHTQMKFESAIYSFSQLQDSYSSTVIYIITCMHVHMQYIYAKLIVMYVDVASCILLFLIRIIISSTNIVISDLMTTICSYIHHIK